ncbi:MAG: hypothetical protein AABY64_06225 [Bdellovibrionota bacterium]
MKTKQYILTISMVLVFSAGALAAESSQVQKESQAAPSTESREQMAKSHEKMALCLRSEASIQDCRQQMHEQCQNMKDKGGCFMMGKMGRGMMENRKKNDSTKDK